MNAKLPRPTTPQTPAHRKQVFWQIILPIVLAAAVVIAIIVLAALSPQGENAATGVWANISLIFMLIPLTFGLFILLATTVAISYGVHRLTNILPIYARLVQLHAERLTLLFKQWANQAADPAIAINSTKAGWDKFWQKISPSNPHQ
ncbi:MAG TPA: hypothetical protein PKG95_13825 [Anaerolineaceae bacterium]|jgi:hypothetical protein|nr:hypothetical protein [Anaerolineaceae bacterium]